MPVVTPDDVAAGFKALWDASKLTDASLIPNGLHHQRVPAGTEPPYGVMTIEEGDIEEFSGPTYIQVFTVKAAVYAMSGATGPATDDKRRACEAAFRRTTAMVVPNADQVIEVKPVKGGLEYAAQMRQGENVVMASGAWDVKVQATR